MTIVQKFIQIIIYLDKIFSYTSLYLKFYKNIHNNLRLTSNILLRENEQSQ